MSDPHAGPPDFSHLDGGEDQLALDAVRAVVNWYNAQIVEEHRAPVPDDARMEDLKAARQAALLDQGSLETAGPEEVARIAALYAAQLKDLTSS